MRHSHNAARRSVLLLAAVAGLAAGDALAQEDGGKAPDRPLLSGPSVQTDGPPGVVEDFGGEGDRRMAMERLPARVLQRILREMLSDQAPEEVRLTPEQRGRVEALREKHEEQRRAYMQENAGELRELRRKADLDAPATDRRRPADQRRPQQDRPARRGGEDRGRAGEDPMEMDPMDAAPAPREREAARQRLREIMAGAPGVESLYGEVWEVLTEPQRRHVEQQIERHREEMSEQRRQAYVDRQMRERRATDGEREMDRPGPRRPMADPEARRQRLLEIFAALSPEEQVQLIDRLERAMGERREGARRERQQRPAPGVDQVKVPRPEEEEQEKPQRRPD